MSKRKTVTETESEEIHWNQQRFLDERAELAESSGEEEEEVQPRSKKTKAQNK